MTKIRIGGVPEHFNLPWHLAIEKGEFKKLDIDVSWTDFKGGTGANIIRNLENALVSLELLETDVFFWEKFTTKPYVDNGKLKRIGEFLTPWPCFVIAATDKIIKQHPEVLIKILRTIHNEAAAFMENSKAIYMVSERYGLEYEDVEEWFHATEWATDGWVSDKMLQSVLYTLKKTKIISASDEPLELVWKR